VGISRDYPLKTQTNKQPIEKILEYELISTHPLKYPRSKQGLQGLGEPEFVTRIPTTPHPTFPPNPLLLNSIRLIPRW
jgi:hypothetical protein